MTDEEALALRRGDVVEVWTVAGWVTAKVGSVDSYPLAGGGSVVEVYACYLGLTAQGRRRPHVSHRPWRVRRPASLPAGTANVYADWLEEHGEPRAAAKLREAFPLPPEGGGA